MTLWRRVAAVTVLVLAVGAVFAIAVSTAVRRSNSAVADLSMRWSPANATAQGLLAHLVDQETGERGFVITGNLDYLRPYEAGRIATSKDIADLRSLVRHDPAIAQAIDSVVSDVSTWRSEAAAPEIAARNSHIVDASRLVDSGVGKRLFEAVRTDVADVQSLIGLRRDAAQADVVKANHSLVRWLWATAAVALIVGAGLALAVSRWVLRPVRQLSTALRRVSGGDLTATVAVAGPPEFVRVGSDADAMRRRMVDELEHSEAARQALEQRGPVVVALSQQLSPQVNAPISGLRYAAALRPAEGMLAGDWVDVLPLRDDRVALMLLDVSGHGAPAGLEAMRLKHVLTTALLFGHAPHEAMERAAAGFWEDERFATAVIVIVDLKSGDLRWANAGHLPPRLVPLNGQRIVPDDLMPLDPTGPLLSSLTSGWETRSLRLEVGQMLLAFSDGLTEARDLHGDEFGIDGLCAALAEATVRDVDTAVSVCLAAVRAHAHDPHRDDITLLAATRDLANVVVGDPVPQAPDSVRGRLT